MLYPKKMKFPDERKAFAFPQEKKVTRKQPNQPTNQIGSVSATDLPPRLSGERNPREGGSPARGKRHEISSGKRGKEKKTTTANHGGGAIWYAPHHRRACRCPGLRSRASLLRRPAPPRTCPGRGTVARRDPGRLPSERTRHVGSSHPLSPTAGERSAKDELAKKREGRVLGGRAREKGREKGRLAMESWEEKASRNPSVWEQCSAMGVGG